MKTYTPPSTVRELTDDDCRDHGIDREDYFPSTRFFLAEWPDRSGWYTHDSAPEQAEKPYWAGVCNADEIFANAEDCQRWLWANVETF